ncbi:hypothetical protein CBS147332_7978 [Penicillium roqueforti]|nr:hypothetical protein CBS147332_7978 [Penicillium roqueforti]KAI3108138.1 hypothetical protein CBS147331_6239 [Penicillium roqueforti]
MIAVHDKDYQIACQKLQESEFHKTVLDRRPAPELLARLPDPDKVMRKVNKKYERLDKSTTIFDYPANYRLAEGLKLIIVPNSFANLPTLDVASDIPTKKYDVYNNISHPLEEALIESMVKGVLIDKDDENVPTSIWGDILSTWIAMMVLYLKIKMVFLIAVLMSGL